MIWSTEEPSKTGNYVVQTTTTHGNHNTMEALFTIKDGKASWSFKNQKFYKYLKEK